MKENYIKKGLFYGGILGLMEATFGYVLHLLPSGISGAVMYPLLFAICMLAYKSSGSLKVIYTMTITATCIKLTNLAIPFLPAVKVINPAIAILLEGLSVALLITFVIAKDKDLNMKSLLLSGFGWRGVYLAYITTNYFLGIKGRMIESGPMAIAEFLCFGFVNAAIIYAADKVLKRADMPSLNIKATTLGTVCTICLAICIQVIGA